MYLFGSRARGTERPDIDFAVVGPRRFDPVRVFDLGLELRAGGVAEEVHQALLADYWPFFGLIDGQTPLATVR